MYWKETGDLSVWKGIAQDALIMNIDDLLCVGAVDNILVSSTIGRNKLLVPGEVISAIINGTDELLAELREMGVGVYATGGETADVGDLVRTIIVDSTVTCRMKRSDVIDNANIRPGDVIVGLSLADKPLTRKSITAVWAATDLPAPATTYSPNIWRRNIRKAMTKPYPTNWYTAERLKLTDSVKAVRWMPESWCSLPPVHMRRWLRNCSMRSVPKFTVWYTAPAVRRPKCCTLSEITAALSRQPFPRSAAVQDHQGAKRYGLERNVQGIQYGTPSGSISFS